MPQNVQSTSSATSKVPPEVFDRVLGCIEDDCDLSVCGQVCKAWLPRTRYKLFSSITIRRNDTGLLSEGSSTSGWHRYVRILCLYGMDSTAPLWSPMFEPHFQTIINDSVVTLRIHDCIFSSFAQVIQIISSFPSLEALEIKATSWRESATTDIPMESILWMTKRPFPKTIRELTLAANASGTKDFAVWCTPTNLPGVTKLILGMDGHRRGDTPSIETSVFLMLALKSLRELNSLFAFTPAHLDQVWLTGGSVHLRKIVTTSSHVDSNSGFEDVFQHIYDMLTLNPLRDLEEFTFISSTNKEVNLRRRSGPDSQGPALDLLLSSASSGKTPKVSIELYLISESSIFDVGIFDAVRAGATNAVEFAEHDRFLKHVFPNSLSRGTLKIAYFDSRRRVPARKLLTGPPRGNE